MKILILGASGFLGKELYNYFKIKYNCAGTQFSQGFEGLIRTDLTDKKEMKKILDETKPDVVIHCLAARKQKGYDKIRFCEAYSGEAYKINCETVRNLVEFFPNKIVLFSTAAVFDGKKGDYTEIDKTNPINIYGKSKLDGEKALIENKGDFLILRIGTLYKDSAGFVYDNLKAGKEITCFYNIYDCPIDAKEVPLILSKLLQENQKGIYHISGEKLSKFQFAMKIAEKYGFNKNLIKPAFYSMEIIPKDTSLKSIKLKSIS